MNVADRMREFASMMKRTPNVFPAADGLEQWADLIEVELEEEYDRGRADENEMFYRNGGLKG